MKILFKSGYKIYYYTNRASILQVLELKKDKPSFTTLENTSVQIEILSRIIEHLIKPTDDNKCIVIDID